MLRFFIFAFATCTSLLSHAQVKVDASKPIRFEYRSPSWNKDSSKEEIGNLLMRETRTGKVVQIQLSEDGGNTGVFIGSYYVSWGEKEIIPEVYVPPTALMQSTEGLRKIETLIANGTLIRKPYFPKADERNNQTIMVFDSKEQALEAFEIYRRQRLQYQAGLNKSAFETQEDAARARAQRLKSMKLEAERKKLDAEERKKLAQLKQEFDSLPKAEQEKRKAQAKQLSSDAMKLFQEGKFAESGDTYLKAAQLDPYNSNHFHRYGVALHRQEKYLHSIVMLNLISPLESDVNEKDFYGSLSYMKLEENEQALRGFQNLKVKNDKLWGAQAALYAGVIQFQMADYEPSKENFEYVLDNSTDPTIDRLAEAYIEQIANAMAFKKQQDKKFVLTLNGGLIYDSNILSTPITQLDQPTDLMGYRWSYGGTVEYRFIYEKERELSLLLGASDMYSTDTKFQAAQNFQNTDPLIFSAYVPYKYKGTAFEKGYQMILSPGYETIQMNADGSGSREAILNSAIIKNEHTFGMREDWFATYAIELRSETSLIDTTTTPEDDLTGTKLSLSTSQIFFQNQKRTEAWIGELGLSQYRANGDDAAYAKFDLAATYMTPWKWDTTVTSRLAYYVAEYPAHTTGRSDKNTTLTLGLRKPISETLAANLTGSYITNQSNSDEDDYRKYMIMTLFTWTTSL